MRRVRVHRLSPGAPDYDLVEFGEPDAVIGVGRVSATGSELLGAAALRGTGPHLGIDAGEARIACGADQGSPARLVWEPSQASRSPLSPIWEIRSDAGTRFVDQGGNVWRELTPGPPGG